MQEPQRFPPRFKILSAAATILVINALLVLIFGNRKWDGLETLVTAADLTPLSGLFWPFVEALAGAIFLAVSFTGRKIRRRWTTLWNRWWRRKLAKAFQDGYNARVAEEKRDSGSSDENISRR